MKRIEIGTNEISIDTVKGLCFDISEDQDCTEYISHPYIAVMSGDMCDSNGNDIGHNVFGFIEFNNIENFKLAERALEILELAYYKDLEDGEINKSLMTNTG